MVISLRRSLGVASLALFFAPPCIPQTTAPTPSPATALPAALPAATAPPATGTSTPPQSAVIASPEAHAATVARTLGSTTSPPTLEQRIARLPPLRNTGISVQKQGDSILAHLGGMLRLYRLATTQLQKVGEPSDILYAEEVRAGATQAAQLAFDSAANEAALLKRVDAPDAAPAGNNASTPPTDSSRIAAARAHAQAQIALLQAQNDSLTQQLAHAGASQRPALLQQQDQVQGGLELEQATAEALDRIGRFSGSQSSQTGLAGDIERLRASVPELAAAGNVKTPAPAMLQNVADARHAGLVTQASVLFDLLSTRRSIEEQIASIDILRKQADDLRQPFVNVLRATVAQGEALTAQSATPPANSQGGNTIRKQFDDLTNTFHVLADATLPLSQESLLLQEQRGTLSAWRVAVDSEYKTILRALLIRLAEIAGALIILAALSTLWSRATVRYVSDLRRRRQLLVVRRVVVGFVGGIIILFGFITQFSSLATFAGFISAGIAVGLQTILLSVAAYFFIIGRYGVRVGDRITVVGVTGTVIEVGLARFYLMELIGSGTELHPTGRVAVFANSVLFQTGTPLYKQLPGTEYAWHELTAKLKPEADPKAASDALCRIVEDVYATYRSAIEGQHQQIEGWMGAAIDPPRVESHLRLVDDGLQVAILFPVQIDGAANTDAHLAAAIVKELNHEGPLKASLLATPVIKAAIKT